MIGCPYLQPGDWILSWGFGIICPFLLTTNTCRVKSSPSPVWESELGLSTGKETARDLLMMGTNPSISDNVRFPDKGNFTE